MLPADSCSFISRFVLIAHDGNSVPGVRAAGLDFENHVIHAPFAAAAGGKSGELQKGLGRSIRVWTIGSLGLLEPLPAHLVRFHPQEREFHDFRKVGACPRLAPGWP